MKEEKWTTIIESDSGSLREELKQLWEYRPLIKMFIKRDFKTMYAQTILGPIWFVLNAFLSAGIMNVVFGKIAGISTDGIPGFLFYMLGNILWSNFSGCLSGVSGTFTGYARLMGKVWFPRMCVPISTVLSRQIRFIIQFAIFFLLYGLYGVSGANDMSVWRMLLFPLLWIQMMALALGCGTLLASCTIKYRDLTVLIGFFLQVWMYVTPIVYPASQVPENMRSIFMLNPMAPIVESFRCILFGGTIPIKPLAFSVVVTGAMLFLGMWVFQRAQRSFLDTV